MSCKNAFAFAAAVALGVVGCGGDINDPVAPPVAAEAKAMPLISLPCLRGGASSRNHMASKPASGCPSNGVGDAGSREMYEYLQRFRRHLGLPCLEVRAYAQAAAAWHAIYMSRHAGIIQTGCFADGHHEKTGCEFFSGVHPRDQLITNGMDTNWDEYNGQFTGETRLCKSSVGEFFAGLLEGPYHREGLMDAKADFGGAAVFWQNHLGIETWAHTIQLAHSIQRTDDGDPETVRYPVQLDTNVPIAFYGNETPQPPRPPGGYPSGYPVSIRSKHGTIEWIAAQFCKAPWWAYGCAENVPFLWLAGQTPYSAHIYAYRPLAPNTRYWVKFWGLRGGVDDDVVTNDWTFMTGAN